MSGAFETLSGAKGIRTASENARRIANFNAAVARQAAVAAKEKAAFAQKRQAKKGVAVESALIAKIAAAGGIGSPVTGELIAEQAKETALENALIGFEGEVEAQRALTQAELDILRGKAAKQKGKAAARAANIQFALQLASFMPGVGGGGSPGNASQVATPQSSPFLTGFASPRTSNIGLLPQF